MTSKDLTGYIKRLYILVFVFIKQKIETVIFLTKENKKQILSISLTSLVFGLILIFLYYFPSVFTKTALHFVANNSFNQDTVVVEQVMTNINKSIATTDKKLSAKIPKNHYMVINTASNEFALYRGNELIREDKCSTGSYILLKKGNKQEWMFKTPKGEFKIRGKTKEPVWKKPDWAFVEEGLPVPSPNHSSRFEYGVLGDYSLNLGDGYLIHGTLFQRFLGLPVTHGCIRLNDENLALVYKHMQIGSKVFIF